MAIEEDLSEWEIAGWGKMISYGFGYVFVNYFMEHGQRPTLRLPYG